MRWWALILVLASCKRDEPKSTLPPTPPPGVTTNALPAALPPDAKTAAEQVFATRCVMCHGLQGNGDGPAALALNPKPRAFSDPEWQKSVGDEQIAKIIQLGGLAAGKSNAMPPNADLSPEVVALLVARVRAFAPK